MDPVLRRIGKYTLECSVGSGGAGIVYKAKDASLNRDVAIKVLHSRMAQESEARQRLYREARSIAGLRHPHIVTIYEIGELDEGQAYLVMEYLTGDSLAEVLRQKETLALEQTLEILEQVGQALDYAHSHGLIHRDVNPKNIMVDWKPDGSLFCTLTDFGMVKVIGSTETLTTDLTGTIEYVAPEQISQALWGEISPATDIYALGVMVHKMLTGHAPFEGSLAKVLEAHLHEWPIDPSTLYDSVSPAVAGVILKALEKDPAQRYTSVAEMVAELHSAAACAKLSEPGEEWGSTIGMVAWAQVDATLFPYMVSIPEGPFWMGSAQDDMEATVNEKPRHLEHLPQYAIAKYPVTNAQYQAFLQATGHPVPPHWYNKDIPAGKASHPVINVSYHDAQEYCRWLSRITHRQYRLPTEYEWEKAARGAAPETRRYPWGDTWTKGWCNSAEEGRQDTSAVDQYEQHNFSPYGIVDLAGNVWEWTDSPYRPYPGSIHYSTSYGTAYIVRGGSWRNDHQDARTSMRGRYKLGVQRPYLGFRIVLEIDR